MCWKCGKTFTFGGSGNSISRDEVCPECGADVRCCKNCRFYDVGSHYDCHENIDELVKDKEKANFCDWFSLAADAASGAKNGAASGADKAKAAKDAFNALFGD